MPTKSDFSVSAEPKFRLPRQKISAEISAETEIYSKVEKTTNITLSVQMMNFYWSQICEYGDWITEYDKES